MAIGVQQIQMIQMYVESNIHMNGVAKFRPIFNDLKQVIQLDYDQFVKVVTHLIRVERIPELTIWSDGNIYKKGGEPTIQQIEVKREPSMSRLAVDGKTLELYYLSKEQVYNLLVNVLHGKEIAAGKVKFESHNYDVDQVMLMKFLDSFCVYDVVSERSP